MSRKKYQYNDKSVGGRLRKFRKSRGDGGVVFSDLLGVSQASLSDYENNKTLISSEAIINLIKNTDINIDWLLTGEGLMTRGTKKIESQDNKDVALYNEEEIDSFDIRNLLINAKKILKQREGELAVFKIIISLIEGRVGRIREGDPPEKKEDFIKMRMC